MDKLTINRTNISDLFVIETIPLADERGSFTRLFCKNELQKAGLKKEIVNINHSKTLKAGTVRGLHYQLMPFGEVKIVKCVKGKIFDVAVDLRKDSPTFLKWFGIELSSENGKMLFIPEGFAHGFQSLEDNSEIIYFNTEFYQKDYERGLLYKDETLNIKWPLNVVQVSDKDMISPKIDTNFEGFKI